MFLDNLATPAHVLHSPSAAVDAPQAPLLDLVVVENLFFQRVFKAFAEADGSFHVGLACALLFGAQAPGRGRSRGTRHAEVHAPSLA